MYYGCPMGQVKKSDSQTCRYDGQIYFHWYKILGLLYKRALFDLQFVHNLFWLKLKRNARSKLFLFYHLSFSMLWWSSRTLTKLKSQSQKCFNERNGHVKFIGYQFGAKIKLVFCAKYDRGLDLGFWEILKLLKWTNITSFLPLKFSFLCEFKQNTLLYLYHRHLFLVKK